MGKRLTDSASNNVKEVFLSSWTPLQNEEANQKIYNDRKQLVVKWFEKWTDSQREEILLSLFQQFKIPQWKLVQTKVQSRFPEQHIDFTRLFPRVVSLYIFSFLDPRSLCRASQVCWHWKYLCESNELWALKCVRLGWILTCPGSSDTKQVGLWKRHYIENIIDLQVTRPAKMLAVAEKEKQEALKRQEMKEIQNQMKAMAAAADAAKKPQPWRAPSRAPKDTRRNNYLDNEVVLQADHQKDSRSVPAALQKGRNDSHRLSTTNDQHKIMKTLSHQMAKNLIEESVLKATEAIASPSESGDSPDSVPVDSDEDTHVTNMTQTRLSVKRPCGKTVFNTPSSNQET